MAISTYAELQTAVANFLNRDDLTSRIPEFISLAEARFNRVIRAPDMMARDDSFTIDSQYEALPSDFSELIRLSIDGSPPRALEYLTPEEMAEKREKYHSSQKPGYVTVAGGNFEFLPTPDSSYTGTLLYYDKIDGLDTTDPNWLLTNHPDIYLFGALVEAEPYVMNDERFPLWKAKLDEALQQLRIYNDRKRTGPTLVAKARSFG